MKAAVLLCLMFAAKIGVAQTTERTDHSYEPRTAQDRTFTPAPMLPEEIYESEERRIAETFDKLKAQGEREVRAVPSIPNTDKVRRSDAVRVLNNAKRAVHDQLEDPEVARGLEAVQVPAGEVVSRGTLVYFLGEVFGIGRRNVDDRRFNLHVTTQPPGAAFVLCLQFQPSQPCLRIKTPGNFLGIHRSHYRYTVTLDGHQGGGDTLDLVHFGQRNFECTLHAVVAAQCSPR